MIIASCYPTIPAPLSCLPGTIPLRDTAIYCHSPTLFTTALLFGFELTLLSDIFTIIFWNNTRKFYNFHRMNDKFSLELCCWKWRVKWLQKFKLERTFIWYERIWTCPQLFNKKENLFFEVARCSWWEIIITWLVLLEAWSTTRLG